MHQPAYTPAPFLCCLFAPLLSTSSSADHATLAGRMGTATNAYELLPLQNISA